MRIYVDEVFLLNTLLNYALLRTARLLTGGREGGWRLWGAAGFGGLYAVLVLLPPLRFLGSLPGQTAAFALLCIIAFGDPRRYWRDGLWFLGVCCAFAGLVLAAAAFLRIPAILRGGRVYYRIRPWLLLALSGGLWGGCRLFLCRFARHRGRELVRLRLELMGRHTLCVALRDTGNTLADPLTGAPVLTARWQVAARLLPELGLRQQDFADPAELLRRLRLLRPELRTRLIPYRAVGTEGGLLPAIRMDRVLEDGKPSAAQLVAFCPTELSAGGSCEALCQG